MSNIPWNYISLNQLMSSVKQDLRLFDEANLIDEDNVIKVIAECNNKLGERIYKSKEVVLTVENGYAQIPSDLHKIENIFIVSECFEDNYYYNRSTGINGNNQFLYSSGETIPYETCDKIIPICHIIPQNDCSCKCKNINECDTCKKCMDYTVSKLVKEDIQHKFKKMIPLSLSNNISKLCTEYYPGNNWKSIYSVDLEDGLFKVPFKNGQLYVSYLGNLQNNDGEIMIPFHPLLNNYYEYAVKEKILMDIFMNSEADVEKKLQYMSLKKSGAYYDAWTFIQTGKAGQWSKMKKQREMEYFNIWYKAF